MTFSKTYEAELRRDPLYLVAKLDLLAQEVYDSQRPTQIETWTRDSLREAAAEIRRLLAEAERKD